MVERLIIIANTSYQLMLAVNLRRNEFRDKLCDVIITDCISDYKSLSRKLKETEIFNDVITLQTKKIYKDSNWTALKHRICNVGISFVHKYNYYVFANLDHSASGIYRILKRRNKNLCVWMYEDGFSSYSGWYSDFLTMYGSKPQRGEIYKRSWYKTLYHHYVDNVFLNVERMYVLNPNLMTYIPKFEIVKMTPIDYKNQEVIETYNNIFSYDESVDSYDKKVIFFEESYYADNYKVNDIEIVNSIANLIGKENIFVKIHPRNNENRFKKLGYVTNENLSIPWEVIAMNIDLSNKILISIASVSVIMPYSLFGKDYNGILVMGMIDDNSFLKKNITSLYEQICVDNKQISIPQSMDELKKLLKL